MDTEVFLRRKFHIITIHQSEHMVIVMRYWKIKTLKLQRSQRENILGITTVVIWYSHTACYHIRARKTAQKTEYRTYYPSVEMEPPHHLSYTHAIVLACTPYLIHVTYGLFTYLVN